MTRGNRNRAASLSWTTTVDTSTGSIKLKATFANSSRRLWPGQFVSVVISMTTIGNAVVVPTRAIQTGQQGQYVYVVKADQTVEARNGWITRTVDNDSIVQSGLASGETVVTDGQLRLSPGAKIKAAQAGYQRTGEAPKALLPRWVPKFRSEE